MHFNGSTAYVSVGTRPELKLTNTTLTLEAWIKPTGRGSDATEGGVICGREGEYLIARYADGTIRYAVANTTPGWTWNNTVITVTTNQWTHVALTYDGTNFTLYLNGIMRSLIGGTGPIGDGEPARNDFYIGNRQFATRLFQGQIDEVRVWNTNRTTAEIGANMTRPLQGNEPGLLAYYRFEEGFGTTTADATGRGLTGTLLNGPVWDCASEALQVPVPLTQPAALVTETTARLSANVSPNSLASSNSFWLAANASTALAFDGVNDAVSFANGPGYNAYPLTATAWVKTAGAGGSAGIVNKYVSGSLNGWQIHLVNGQVRAWYFRDTSNYAFGGGDGLNGGNVDDGQWHHVAFSVGAAGAKLYVDGQLMATNGWTGTPGACTTTQPLRFGAYDVYPSLAGQLDDVTLWNTELTRAAIAQLMTAPPTPAHPQYANLVGYWPLDEGAGTFVSEAWGRTPAGLLTGGPAWEPQARPVQYVATPLTALSGTNSALDLDGVDDFVRVPAGIWFSNEFTIESWVFERSYNQFSRVIDFGNGAGNDNVLLSLSYTTPGRPYFQVFPAGQFVLAPDVIPLNQWIHLAATLKSNVATIYINGVAVTNGTVTAPSGTVIRNNNYIGRSNWGADPYANALFDELRLWKVARTADQIRQFMTEAVSPGDTNLVLNYRFDEPSGLTAVDSRSANPQNGTLTNGAARLPCERTSVDVTGLTRGMRYHFRSLATNSNGTDLGLPESFATLTPGAGTALEFDATNDFVHTPSLRSYFTNETVTLEVWFNARGPGVIVDERSVDLVTWADSQIEIVGTANALQGEVRIRVWNTGSVSLGKVAYGTWNHAVLRYNKTTLTLDGFLNGAKSATALTSVDRQAPWESSATYGVAYALGMADGNSLGSGVWFNGQLDEFRVWTLARTDADILRDFNRRLSGSENGLAAYYRMDEGAGSVLADATGHGNDALRLGTNNPAWVSSTAPVGWPLVTTPEVTGLVLGDVTLDTTVKGDASTDTRTWIEYGQYVPVANSAENIVYFYYYPNVPQPVSSLSQVNFDGAPYAAYGFTTIDFNTGAGRNPPWGYVQFCAARYLGRIFLPTTGTYTFYIASDDGSQLYVDGQLMVTNDGLHGPIEGGASTNLAAGYHRIEARMFNDYGEATLIASYAGPGIPKQVIPATAFLRQQVTNWTRTPPQTNAVATGFQDFNAMATNIGGSGTYVFRVAAANATGTNYGPEQPVLMGSPGAFTALYFNGIGAHVEVPDGADLLAFPNRDPFTLEAWVNPILFAATQTVVSKFSQPVAREYFLALNAQAQVIFHRQGSDFVSSNTVPAGSYTHLAVTYDGTRRHIYINGQLDPAVDPGSGPITNWTAPFVIGARFWSNSLANYFQGTIDDVRVWQVARSQTQIAGDMNRRLSGYELGLIAYYRFDEAQGDVAYDSTVYQSPGWLVNSPVYVPSGATFACSALPPILNIALLDFAPGVVIWWPITCNEYVLEEADIPNPPADAWYPVLEPVTPIGDTYTVVLLRDRWNNGYFRLRRL